MGSASVRCTRRVAFHAVVGGLVGYAVLHPLSMLVFRYSSESGEGSVWDVLRTSFSAGHTSMAAHFTVIGAALGAVYGFHSCRTARLYEKVRRLSLTDDLTSLCNRRCLMRWLDAEIARARRYSGRLSLLMIDVDHFKQYNDTYGHQRGDELLRALAGRLRTSTRRTDLIARYGGEEFVVVMRETDKATALGQAERICGRVANHYFLDRDSRRGGRATISLGVAEFPTDARDVNGLIRAADAALYKAKAEGRNRAFPGGS
jgi:diguanylate cyclase (GGDEF)-like protein